jgi:hypothetical protein
MLLSDGKERENKKSLKMLLQDGAFRFPSTDNTFGNNIVFMR